jgi:hypothetical protein
MKPLSVGVTHRVITKYHNQNKSRGINAGDIRPVTRHSHQSILRTFSPHNCLSQCCSPLSLTDLHITVLQAVSPSTCCTQPFACLWLTSNLNSAPLCWPIKVQMLHAVVTALLNPWRQAVCYICHLFQYKETFSYATRELSCFQRFSEQTIIICLCTFNI